MLRGNRLGDVGLSIRVVDEISAAKGVPAEDLTPLYSEVDPDALDSLFRPRGDAARGPGHVTFEYEGYTVRAHHDGRVEVSERK